MAAIFAAAAQICRMVIQASAMNNDDFIAFARRTAWQKHLADYARLCPDQAGSACQKFMFDGAVEEF